jgi:hypothetical protein
MQISTCQRARLAAGAGSRRRCGDTAIRRRSRRLVLIVVAAVAQLVLLGMFGTGGAGAAAQAQPPGSARPAAAGPGARPNPESVTAAQAYTCAATAYKAGIPYYPPLHTNDGLSHPPIVVAIAVGLAESGCSQSASNHNGPTSGCPDGSTDRGVWQINDCYWSRVSNSCAYQAQCNANAVFGLISSHGRDWCPWSTYAAGGNCGVAGAWVNYLPAAEQIVSGGFTLQLENQGSGSCLAAKEGAGGDRGVVWQWHCADSGHYGQWRVIPSSPSTPPRLQNVGSGSCLAAKEGAGGDAGVIWQWRCANSAHYGEWSVLGSGQLNTDGNADARLRNAGSGGCVVAKQGAGGNRGVIEQWNCATSRSYGKWN